MNPKLVTIGVVVALAAVMVGALAIGSQNAFARDQGGNTHINQHSSQVCIGENNGCNQNNNNNVNGDNKGDNIGNDNDFGHGR